MRFKYKKLTLLALLMSLTLTLLHAAPPSTSVPRSADIRSTKHNLSTAGPGTTKATSESQICVFCHTPHGANPDSLGLKAPLWNRNITPQSYTPYSSASVQANIDSNPGGSSKLCLSCHDGTLAIGSVNVLNGQTDVSINMSATIGTTGLGDSSGFTRKIGLNLSNDHPISFSFDTSLNPPNRLAEEDGELRDPIDPDGSHIRTPSPGDRPPLPLDHDGLVQCTTCHDPHISGQDIPTGTSLLDNTASNIKFLRGRRFQMDTPLGGNYVHDDDIVCIGCHDKGGQNWSQSAHANPLVANEAYLDAEADRREFPRNIQVWQAACLNCHDTHTVEGSRRLLREGTDDTGTPKLGGNSAIEETCYQCHSNIASSILSSSNNNVPDIKTDFTTKTRRMPITSSAQPAGSEVHNIQDADFTETPANLGFGNLANRHAECTDCHNPHRVLKNSEHDGGGLTTQGTHEHTTSTIHTNKASGALTGTSGVEPIYGANRKFGDSGSIPTGFTDKFGMGADKVTKEYQVCLKCHSNYSYNDNGGPDNAIGSSDNGRPETGGSGLTPYSTISTSSRQKAQTNSFRNYTNQAMEFYAPSNHADEPLSVGTDGGASSDYNTNNHRSWHPVMAATGRTASERSAAASNWLAPWDNAIGSQTMYCTDCHGSDNGSSTNVSPSSGAPWGPHGSNRDFILKGTWPRGSARVSSNGNMLCFKCHSSSVYTGGGGSSSGFGGGSKSDNNNHALHQDRIGNLDCMWCHVAVPHGWKNKAFLVNLNDLGPEVMCRTVDASSSGYDVRKPDGTPCDVGQPMLPGSYVNKVIGGGGSEVGNDSTGYNNPPYYVNARLRISSFGNSGNWGEGRCGGKDNMTDNLCDRDAGH